MIMDLYSFSYIKRVHLVTHLWFITVTYHNYLWMNKLKVLYNLYVAAMNYLCFVYLMLLSYAVHGKTAFRVYFNVILYS